MYKKSTALVPAITTQRKAPARVESPVNFIPDSLWRMMLQNAALGSARLQNLLVSPNFPKLPVKDQLAIVHEAHEQAFGVASRMKQTVTVEVTAEEGDNGKNALRTLANRALELPEFAMSADKQRRN